MAGRPATTAGTDAPEAPEAPADVVAVVDTADTSPRAAGPDLSGKRLRAIPPQNASTVTIRASDFADNGIEHPEVTFDFRKDKYTLAVGDKQPLSTEAADFLAKFDPMSFEYINNGE